MSRTSTSRIIVWYPPIPTELIPLSRTCPSPPPPPPQLRTVLALAILAAARSLPFLAYVMALVGSFMTISVSVTFPAICHLVLHKGQLSAGKVAWNYFVAALGIACTLAGTAASLRSLAAKAASVAAGGA